MKCFTVIIMAAALLMTCYAEEWESVVTDLTAEEMLDLCMDGIYHKDKPGAEPNLHDQCAQWSNRSCCFSNVSEEIHDDGVWHDINWYHCGQNALSEECHKFLVQDSCFYECSPNVGPWLVEHKISIRNERFVDVPLCASECNAWWDACKDDMTCSDNWAKGWDWSSGTASCPDDKPCRSFAEYFDNATNFCANLWGGSFKVVPDNDPDMPCMKMFWQDAEKNPNDEVAVYYANKKSVSGSVSLNIQSSLIYLTAALLLVQLDAN
ncbi:folate receptor alpha-like [Ptychodera flava]|uniref:folate receptor alpha-like n=1 Tax=Ptychodera flava TaxID=63121 RepID=UPI00396A363C